MQNKNLVILLVILILIIVGAVAVYFIFPEFGSKVARVVDIRPEKPQVIEEKLVIPNTQKINGIEGRFGNEITETTIQTPLVPKTEAEKVIVSKAVLTAKGSYDLAKTEAGKWSTDAKPVFIKSLGAVTLEGKSSQWQLAFSSKTKLKKGYEVIIQADQIVSMREIESTVVGANLPENLPDLGGIIKELQSHPLYQDVTVSAISLYLNPDDKKWYYNLTTSRGASTIIIQ